MSGFARRFMASRSPGDRLAITVLAATIGISLLLWFAHSAQRARETLAPSVVRLAAESARLVKSADEIARLRVARPTRQAQPAAPGDFRALMQARIDTSGIAGSATSLESPAADRVKVSFASVSFAEWLRWVDSLQAQQVRVETLRIEALPATGLVSVAATFAGPAQ